MVSEECSEVPVLFGRSERPIGLLDKWSEFLSHSNILQARFLCCTHAVERATSRAAGYDCENNATVREGQGTAAETTPRAQSVLEGPLTTSLWGLWVSGLLPPGNGETNEGAATLKPTKWHRLTHNSRAAQATRWQPSWQGPRPQETSRTWPSAWSTSRHAVFCQRRHGSAAPSSNCSGHQKGHNVLNKNQTCSNAVTLAKKTTTETARTYLYLTGILLRCVLHEKPWRTITTWRRFPRRICHWTRWTLGGQPTNTGRKHNNKTPRTRRRRTDGCGTRRMETNGRKTWRISPENSQRAH